MTTFYPPSAFPHNRRNYHPLHHNGLSHPNPHSNPPLHPPSPQPPQQHTYRFPLTGLLNQSNLHPRLPIDLHRPLAATPQTQPRTTRINPPPLVNTTPLHHQQTQHPQQQRTTTLDLLTLSLSPPPTSWTLWGRDSDDSPIHQAVHQKVLNPPHPRSNLRESSVLLRYTPSLTHTHSHPHLHALSHMKSAVPGTPIAAALPKRVTTSPLTYTKGNYLFPFIKMIEIKYTVYR